MSETIGIFVGLLLTVFIYSYLVNDNPLYKIGVHILIGVSAAYAGVVVMRQIIIPIFNEIAANPSGQNSVVWLIPLLFSILLLLQRFPAIAWLSQVTVALMIGIGSAVALNGALRGTLGPQLALTGSNDLFVGQSIVVAVLTAVTLLSFQFTQQIKPDEEDDSSYIKNRGQLLVSHISQTVLTITFGFLFAAVFNTSLLVLTDRVGYFLVGLGQFINGLGQLIQ